MITSVEDKTFQRTRTAKSSSKLQHDNRIYIQEKENASSVQRSATRKSSDGKRSVSK